MSLADSKVTAVVPVSDLMDASEFYTNVLGLSPVDGMTSEGAIIMQCGGDTTLQLYLSPSGAGASEATIATFSVDDLDAEMQALQDKGVVFEEYDMPGFQTEDGVYTDDTGAAAWFKDPEGNVLCLHEMA